MHFRAWWLVSQRLDGNDLGALDAVRSQRVAHDHACALNADHAQRQADRTPPEERGEQRKREPRPRFADHDKGEPTQREAAEEQRAENGCLLPHPQHVLHHANIGPY